MLHGIRIKAVALYSSRAEASVDANEKALYTMLAEWRGTPPVVALIDRELREEVWYDNNFWAVLKYSIMKRSGESVQPDLLSEFTAHPSRFPRLSFCIWVPDPIQIY